MKTIVLAGCAAALPTLEYLYQQRLLYALLRPLGGAGSPGLREVERLENWALMRGLPNWEAGPDTIEKDLSELIGETAPDLVLLFGFPYKISPELLRHTGFGGWNVHFNLVPARKGDGGIDGIVDVHEWRGLAAAELILEQGRFHIPEGIADPMSFLGQRAVPLVAAALRNAKQDKKVEGYSLPGAPALS